MMEPKELSPMSGLMSAKPGMESEMGEMPTENPVAGILQQAIELHEGHLSGAIPTTPESQNQLMELLVQAISMVG